MVRRRRQSGLWESVPTRPAGPAITSTRYAPRNKKPGQGFDQRDTAPRSAGRNAGTRPASAIQLTIGMLSKPAIAARAPRAPRARPDHALLPGNPVDADVQKAPHDRPDQEEASAQNRQHRPVDEHGAAPVAQRGRE